MFRKEDKVKLRESSEHYYQAGNEVGTIKSDCEDSCIPLYLYRVVFKDGYSNVYRKEDLKTVEHKTADEFNKHCLCR